MYVCCCFYCNPNLATTNSSQVYSDCMISDRLTHTIDFGSRVVDTYNKKATSLRQLTRLAGRPFSAMTS